MRRLDRWPIVVVASAVGAELTVAYNLALPIRTVLAFWFLLIGPGMAFVPLLHVEGRLTALTLGIALSLAVDVISAETMVLARIWTLQANFAVLVGLSLGGALLQMGASRLRAQRSQRVP